MEVTTERTFAQWMVEVDKACYKRAFLSVHDLPDCCYRDWYDDGVSPGCAARKALRAARE